MDHLHKPRQAQATLTGSGPAPDGTAPAKAKAASLRELGTAFAGPKLEDIGAMMRI